MLEQTLTQKEFSSFLYIIQKIKLLTDVKSNHLSMNDGKLIISFHGGMILKDFDFFKMNFSINLSEIIKFDLLDNNTSVGKSYTFKIIDDKIIVSDNESEIYLNKKPSLEMYTSQNHKYLNFEYLPELSFDFKQFLKFSDATNKAAHRILLDENTNEILEYGDMDKNFIFKPLSSEGRDTQNYKINSIFPIRKMILKTLKLAVSSSNIKVKFEDNLMWIKTTLEFKNGDNLSFITSGIKHNDDRRLDMSEI